MLSKQQNFSEACELCILDGYMERATLKILKLIKEGKIDISEGIQLLQAEGWQIVKSRTELDFLTSLQDGSLSLERAYEGLASLSKPQGPLAPTAPHRMKLLLPLCIIGSLVIVSGALIFLKLYPRPQPAPEVTVTKILKHDDRTMEGKWSISGAGHAVKFHAPSGTGKGSIVAVDIYGAQYGYSPEDWYFTVEICDAEMKSLTTSKHSYDKFRSSFDWVRVKIPPVTVQGNFYVLVSPGSMKHRGIYIGYDSSVENMWSEIVNSGELSEWTLSTPKKEVNWMIRAELQPDVSQ